MIFIVLGLIGAISGGVYLYGRGGFLLGGVIGLLAAAVVGQRSRLLDLEKRVTNLQARVGRPSAAAGATDRKAPPPNETGVSTIPVSEPPPSPETPSADLPFLELELSEGAMADAPPAPSTPQFQRPAPARTKDPFEPIRKWLLGGNLMVRVGVVVLLFGFAFLVKYAAARNLVPLEVRLTAAFAAGIGLLVLGWRLRQKRFGYAVSLQGGGIGVMYLTLFAAARLFHLVPLPLTFLVMVGLVVFSGILAVLQNAAVMAVIGAAGGFLAPVLLSTGTGSHVMLFSYYALLNAGIFGIAWFKAWRWLNLLGFVFTFGIGAAWGLQYYQSPYFTTTEPFLILFFVFYLAISVLFALRQPPRLKGYVDGTLVFGMPLVVFSLQVGLVKQFPLGLALSAVAMGLIYTGLATALWRRREDGLAALVEAFLALGVIFGSLAIPLALSGSWTAVAWSLEGAGLVWVGLRQKRWTARGFGILLQVGAGVAFLMGSHGDGSTLAVFNNRFMGGMMVGLAGLLSAFLLERFRDQLYRPERVLIGPVLAWGLAWWFGTGLNEIDRCLSRRHELAGALAFVGINALAMGVCYRRLDWKGLRWPALGLLPAMILITAANSGHIYFRHPFQGWWLAVWPLALGAHGYLLRTLDRDWPARVSAVWHVTGALFVVFLLSWECAWLLDRMADGAPVWAFAAWGALPAVAVGLLIRLRAVTGWPLRPWTASYQGWLPAFLVFGLVAWGIRGLFMDGDPRPLPYLPLFNPMDLVQLFVFLVVVNWVRIVRREAVLPAASLPPGVLWGVPAVGGLFWLTAVVARTVHHLAGVAYDWEIMIRSGLFQAAVAVLWGLVALGAMVAANRFRQRALWFSGAALLAVVVGKLFVVDLSGSGTISRIVSFLAVGALLLVIGFFTPLPPSNAQGETP
ncbi:membrane protein [Desulfosarcina ovata subsp. sediminis]|uniref:Membrane protein n=1 Tax=Desulfosarcina ovata subsp. sediminis TaxID=885957 RepID=A0A5K7ZLX8_9BACT|nr:DUF2339 domain-containing protein [Desulfosarcina ovata]BBO82484.1 membrane protein [Desulfosarcina ovata subsp. sediminis]